MSDDEEDGDEADNIRGVVVIVVVSLAVSPLAVFGSSSKMAKIHAIVKTRD